MPRQLFTRTVKVLALDLIDRDPDQPRKKFRKLEDLASSILQSGLLQPPEVKHHPTIPGRYMITYGERRFKALQLAGFEEHEFEVLEGEVIDTDERQAAENQCRENLNVIEEGQLAHRLLHVKNKTMAETEKIMGLSSMTIYSRLKLLDLPDEVQQMIIDEKLPPANVLKLHKSPFDEQIRIAHALVKGVSLELQEQQLTETRRARKQRASADNPAEVMLARVMSAVWRHNSEITHLEALLSMGEPEFRALLFKIKVNSRQTLEERYAKLAAVAMTFVKRLEELHPQQQQQSDPVKAQVARAAAGPSQPTVVSRPAPASPPPPPMLPPVSSPERQKRRDFERKVFPEFTPSLVVAPVRERAIPRRQILPQTAPPEQIDVAPKPTSRKPIVFNGGTMPEEASIKYAGKASAERYTLILRSLFCNPVHRGTPVNLSRARLRGLLGLARAQDAEDYAFAALNAARASWGLTVNDLQPGQQRAFVAQMGQMRSMLGGDTFPEVINKAWLDLDRSSDPIDLTNISDLDRPLR